MPTQPLLRTPLVPPFPSTYRRRLPDMPLGELGVAWQWAGGGGVYDDDAWR